MGVCIVCGSVAQGHKNEKNIFVDNHDEYDGYDEYDDGCVESVGFWLLSIIVGGYKEEME